MHHHLTDSGKGWRSSHLTCSMHNYFFPFHVRCEDILLLSKAMFGNIGLKFEMISVVMLTVIPYAGF